MYHAFVGAGIANASGELAVYIDNGQTYDRTWYDGVGHGSPHCGQKGQVYEVADINLECYVNLEDFALLASEWIECTDPEVTFRLIQDNGTELYQITLKRSQLTPSPLPIADIDKDGRVDVDDLRIMSEEFLDSGIRP